MKILITGANRGLGLCLAQHAVKRGHEVIAAVRNKKNLSVEFTNWMKDYEQQVQVLEMDVADENLVARAAKEAAQANESIDVIINNAGIILGKEDTIETIDFDEVRRTFEINAFGVMRVVKHFLPLLLKGSNQALINVSSDAGSITNAHHGYISYGLSKVVVNMFTEQMHKGYKDIMSVAVHPGWMFTDMGGEEAPTDPNITAEGILDIMERKIKIDEKYQYVDYTGKAMTI